MAETERSPIMSEESKGGEAEDGPLVMACFQVLWMKDCIRAMNTAKELATVYPSCKFCSVQADTLELQQLSRKLKIEEFPTFILFRGGKEIERFSGHERVAESIVRILEANITEKDKERYELKRRQKEEENAQAKGSASGSLHQDTIPAEDGDSEIEWIWDIDGTGNLMRIEEFGMMLSLRDEDDDMEVVWEYCYDSGSWGVSDDDPGWTAFSEDLQEVIEQRYRQGELYTGEETINIEPSDTHDGVSIWKQDVVVRVDSVTGLHGEFVDDDSDSDDDDTGEMYVRRKGPRVAVPGEPEMSEAQKKLDSNLAARRAEAKRHRKWLALQRRGRDVEAARGTAGLAANSGLHRWELKWLHEPARGGAADAVGLCSESFENFGPCKEPCLGGKDEMTSIGFYATGEVYYGDQLLLSTKHRREVSIVEENQQKSETTTDTSGHRYKVDDRVIVGVDGSETYSGRIRAFNPTTDTYVIVLDHFDDVEYPVKGSDILSKMEPEVTSPAPCWGQNSIITVVFDTNAKGGSGILTFLVDGVPINDVVIEGVFNKLGGGPLYPAVCMCPISKTSDNLLSSATIRQPSESMNSSSNGEDDNVSGDSDSESDGSDQHEQELNNSALTTSSKQMSHPSQSIRYPTILLLGEKRTPAPERRDKKLSKKAKNENEESKAANTQDDYEEIPIERCIWMWETEDGWEKYPKDISAQLETARRNNKQEIQVRVHGRPLTIRLVGTKDGTGSAEPEQKSEMGETARVRRHVVSEGLQGQWEILSLKFSLASRSLRGSSALEMLTKVWCGDETIEGRNLGLGFLFLYTLLVGQSKVKIINTWADYSGGYGFGYGAPFGGYGGYGGYETGYSSYYFGDTKKAHIASSGGSNDSHRFATLLAQLYSDRRNKSICNSIINVLVRNKQLCMRMPKLKDMRKAKKPNVFNGWVDERDPRSPLADLFSQVVPTLQGLKSKRGTIQFPPRPPYPELAPLPKECPPITTLNGLSKGSRAWLRPELSDFACESRKFEPIAAPEIAQLAINSAHRILKTGNPPIDVEEDDEFYEILVEAGQVPVVVLFYAKWCSSCTTLTPVFRSTAIRTPVAKFVRVDVDECDKLATSFEVQKLPHTIFIKNTPDARSPRDCDATLIGGGPNWVVEFDKIIAGLLSEEDNTALVKYRSEISGSTPPEFAEAMESAEVMQTLNKEMQALAEWPSVAVASGVISHRTREELGKPRIGNQLPFNIAKHDAAVTAVAESMLQRIKDDVIEYANATNSDWIPSISCLPEEAISLLFDGADSESLTKGRQGVQDILNKLRKARDDDAKMVSAALPLLFKAANHVDVTSEILDQHEKQMRVDFLLRRQSGQEPHVWLEFLYGSLLSSQSKKDLLRLNPYLSDESISTIQRLTTCVILRANRVGHTNRCIAAAIKLDDLLGKLSEMSADRKAMEKQTMLPRVNQSAEALAGLLSTKRHYMSENGTFDPRFMVFEFVWNLCLRKKQIEIVEMFRENLAKDISKVKQMIMGAGKTTVVAPLLALMLADGKSLVLSVVPKALLEMSRTLMRETFASIMNKRIYTLRFDRSTKVTSAMRRMLENAIRNRGIVVATPTTVKSIMLSYLEALEHLNDARAGKYKYEPVDVVAKRCAELASVLSLFRSGVMLLDEVDLILHPLKSELNFPKGEKFDLDVSEQGERWGLPIHLIDAIFYAESGRVTAFEARGGASDILRRLESVVREGYTTRSLQRLPHITLLNADFYSRRMKPILAEWAYLWLQKQHLHGIDRDEAVRYVLTGAAARSEGKAKEQILEKALKDDSATDEAKKHLSKALSHAKRNQILTDVLYEAEEQLETFLEASAQSISQIDAEIAALNRAIKEAEFPRDDSLDNAVVVWFSQAFAPSRSGTLSASKLASLRALGTLCSELESNGYTLKRCDVAEEAATRVRDLQASGHLRCVIIGGGEGVVGCSNTCEDSHSGPCIVCGDDWGSHSGHTCPDGRHGSWPASEDELDLQDEQTMENVAFVESLLSTVGHVPLPSDRVALYGGHATFAESVRKVYWNMGIYVAEDDQKLQTWCDQIQDWPLAEIKDE